MRWMLGAFEAGLFPGVTYYLSWYVRLALLCAKALSDLYHDVRAVGISVRNLVSALPYSSRLRPFPAHLVAFSLYVPITTSGSSNLIFSCHAGRHS